MNQSIKLLKELKIIHTIQGMMINNMEHHRAPATSLRFQINEELKKKSKEEPTPPKGRKRKMSNSEAKTWAIKGKIYQ